ncbi:MAG: RluA family pseudouridine synthase [Ruminococcaceae bacterium]|nr:RluA family pseudouridine synthase [Oscillospiraceae bacterium]
MELYIDAERAGKTVFDVLRRELGFSNRLLARLKQDERGILVDGERVTVRYPLRRGQRLTLAVEDRSQSETILPVDLPVSVLYEDEFLWGVNKPPEMPTHPSHGHYDDTLANALAWYAAQRGEPFVFRPVNRLDRNTSGVVLIARDQRAAGVLARTMQQRQMKKRYLALLDGELYPDAGTLSAPIRRRAESIIFREVCGEGEGDEAITAWRVLARDGGYTLVEASPETGRTHQLRVHFAHLGCPIHGDDLYGNAAEDMPRQALHASTLTFPHPVTGEEIILKAPLPEDFRNLLITLFGKDMLL